jgi:hypothetical protein
MTANDNVNPQQFRPIKASELPLNLPTAAATSHPVSSEEFQSRAAAGHAELTRMAGRKQSTAGFDNDWQGVKDRAWNATREPWGGGTYSPRTGRPVEYTGKDKHALTVREPDQSPITVAPEMGREHFDAAMDQARDQYAGKLQRANHFLGAFHDADQKRIDIDPVAVVSGRRKSQNIMAATHAVGGAYHFASGDGVWPPHVQD